MKLTAKQKLIIQAILFIAVILFAMMFESVFEYFIKP